MSNILTQLSIRELMSESVEYVIPMYQRNYAWGEAEITQLLQDVIDYMPSARRYHIGTLVVFARPENGRVRYETIDGQQRLTTLSLLAAYLRRKKAAGVSWCTELCVRFESRPQSHKTFAAIFEGRFEHDPSELLAEQDTNAAILEGYRLLRKLLPKKLQENDVSEADFTRYLFQNVVLMRVPVPPETDLNHYFEVMNSRGEQLEKHEVLKAQMAEVLQDIPDPIERAESQQCLHEVWEACADMDRYLQMGFIPAVRTRLFGPEDWGQFSVNDFAQLRAALGGSDHARASHAPTLNAILAGPAVRLKMERPREEAPERFHSVVNFSNFLLHVLRVMTRKDVALDDKRLIASFEEHVLKEQNPIVQVKGFILALLRCRFLFDHYVIKREFSEGKDRWSLKRLKWYTGTGAGKAGYTDTFAERTHGGENRRILMLQAAFHVSNPTPLYKYWLNAALDHLYHAPALCVEAYRRQLESVARAFVFDRFLAVGAKVEYVDIIHANAGHCQARRSIIVAEEARKKLSYDNIENNLVFNYLDYLLWLKDGPGNKQVAAFEFTFRSSVEHYYPRTPMPGIPPLDGDVLDSFGNLCLISHSKNSRLSNLTPMAKQDYYRHNNMDSIKQYLMMKASSWGAAAIAQHDEQMWQVLVASLEQ
jgi:hypothetical protein